MKITVLIIAFEAVVIASAISAVTAATAAVFNPKPVPALNWNPERP